jgi:hypothetical protein
MGMLGDILIVFLVFILVAASGFGGLLMEASVHSRGLKFGSQFIQEIFFAFDKSTLFWLIGSSQTMPCAMRSPYTLSCFSRSHIRWGGLHVVLLLLRRSRATSRIQWQNIRAIWRAVLLLTDGEE